MKVLFACMGGMSSSLIASRFKDYLLDEGYTADFIEVTSQQSIDEIKSSNADYTIAYMHVMGINNENRKKHGQIFDAILIAPQSGYLIHKLRSDAVSIGHEPKRIERIPNLVYGRSNNESLLNLIEAIYKRCSI